MKQLQAFTLKAKPVCRMRCAQPPRPSPRPAPHRNLSSLRPQPLIGVRHLGIPPRHELLRHLGPQLQLAQLRCMGGLRHAGAKQQLQEV